MILDIIEHAGVDIRYSGRNGEIWICCPFCESRDEAPDKRFRLGINVTRAAGHCFNCEWKGRGVEFIGRELSRAYGLKFQGLTAYRERRKIEKAKETEPPVEAKKVAPEIVDLPEGYEKFSRSPGPVEEKVRSYLRVRGVSVMQMIRHHIGYAEAGKFGYRVLFPVIGADKAVHGCVGRAILSHMKPKYLNTPGIKALWGTQHRAKTAVVVEGILDALHVETALLREHDMVSVARLGSAITPLQMDQLKEYEKVIIFPDHDKAGVTGAMELGTRTMDRGIGTYVVVPPAMTGRDPGDMDEDEISSLLHDAVRWNKSAELRLSLAATKEADTDVYGDSATRNNSKATLPA